MSTYLVSDASIDVIVAAAHKYGVIKRRSADVVGQAIKRQNQYAVACRYPTDPESELPQMTEYAYTPYPRLLKRAAVASVIDNWFYQCSEFTGYGDTAVSVLVAEVANRNGIAARRSDPEWSTEDQPLLDVADRDDVMVRDRFADIDSAVDPDDEADVIDLDVVAEPGEFDPDADDDDDEADDFGDDA